MLFAETGLFVTPQTCICIQNVLLRVNWIWIQGDTRPLCTNYLFWKWLLICTSVFCFIFRCNFGQYIFFICPWFIYCIQIQGFFLFAFKTIWNLILWMNEHFKKHLWTLTDVQEWTICNIANCADGHESHRQDGWVGVSEAVWYNYLPLWKTRAEFKRGDKEERGTAGTREQAEKMATRRNTSAEDKVLQRADRDERPGIGRNL